MKYYIIKNGQQLGPMEPYEAAQLGITPDTMVWTDGMADWAPAGQIAEFAPFFAQQPPMPRPYPPTAPVNPQPIGFGAPQCPSTHMAMAILVTLFCCLPFGIVSIVYASKVEGCFYSGNYAQAQQNSDKAKNWAIAGIISAVVISFIYVLIYGVALAGLAY